MTETGYVSHPLFWWHDTGTAAGLPGADPIHGVQPLMHFENADTKRRIHELVHVSGLLQHLHPSQPRPANEPEILRVHTPEHLEYI
jgi:acetoin utilization deacetylase AcuC-like enzyme